MLVVNFDELNEMRRCAFDNFACIALETADKSASVTARKTSAFVLLYIFPGVSLSNMGARVCVRHMRRLVHFLGGDVFV